MSNALGTLFGNIANAIREKNGETGTMKPAEFPEKILGIEGSSPDVCYVTFMSYDGTVEYGKKAVAVGDDCADPITRGIFATPTRESTAQYNYTFAGWATEANGGLDSTALKAVSADRTVYANFAAVVRYYTISFYDGDTLLTTKSVAYGSVPSYTPTKDGYDFVSWNPELAAVTGDASYYAQWKVKATFETATWEEIIEIAESGNASSYFAVGDKRTDTISYEDGTTEELQFIVAGFGECTLEDGTASNLVIVAGNALNTTQAMLSTTSGYFYNGYLASYLNNEFLNALPTELQSGIKTAKVANATLKCWLPCLEQMNTSTNDYSSGNGSTTALPLFSDNASRIRTLGINGAATIYWTRNFYNSGNYTYFAAINVDGSVRASNNARNNKYGVVPAFCI